MRDRLMRKEFEKEIDPIIHPPEVPPEEIISPLAIPEIRVKRIFIFLGVFYATVILIRIFYVDGPSLFTLLKEIRKPDVHVPRAGSILFDFFLYMCAACQFFPIPTLPPIAFVSKVFHPVLVSFVGAIGTCIANFNDYAILGWLFRHHRIKKIRDIRTYRRLLHFFDKYAFLTLSAAAFLPIPVDVVRLMAISRAYSYWKYVAATFTGRFPRYLLIAYVGKELPFKWIIIIFLISIVPAGIKLLSGIIKKRRKA
jgi:membrane protein YqaA with SNARE-associated domain